MARLKVGALLVFSISIQACGGAAKAPATEPARQSSASAASSKTSGEDGENAAEQGAGSEETSWSDWKSFTNVSPGPWISPTHGTRFVEIYVNEVGLEAYLSGAPMPEGSIVVKPSWENEEGAPGQGGPLFVMEKRAAGYAPDSGDWFYAFQWESPPAKWATKLGNPVDWRSPSTKVEYCVDCHDSLDRGLGMPPKERREGWPSRAD